MKFKVIYYSFSKLRSCTIDARNWDDAYQQTKVGVVQYLWDLISIEVIPEDETDG